jgi:hypothetical protein
MTVPQADAEVTVTLTDEHSMWIEYEGQRMYFMMAPESEPVDPVYSTYASVIEQLRAGRFIVKGKGYAFSFPLSEAERVRTSLSKIPKLAKLKTVDEVGVPYYEPVTIDGFLWSNGVIRDFVGR